MDRAWKSGAIATPPVHTENAAGNYPTAGDPLAPTTATKPGPFWFHMITEELRALVTHAGLTPDKSVLTQVRDAVLALIGAFNGDACQGRLTPTSGTPVISGSVTGVTSIYFTPFDGNTISLYDGSAWNPRTFAEITISLAGLTASKPYDVFAYDNGGTVTIETLVWTDATTRATALAVQNGRLVKSGAATSRYVGTIYINASGGQLDHGGAKCGVWNCYNRRRMDLVRVDTSDTWTYTTNSLRAANNNVANAFDIVTGLAEDAVEAFVLATGRNSTAQVGLVVGIGLDSTSAIAAGSITGYTDTPVANYQIHMMAKYAGKLLGRHTLTWLELSRATGTTTWSGDNGDTVFQSGMVGSILC